MEVNMTKLTDVPSFLLKLPKAFLGTLAGLVLGGIGGGLFANIGYAAFVPWEAIFLFLGALFGFLLGLEE